MFIVDKDLKELLLAGIIKLKIDDHFLLPDELGDRIRPCSINLRLSKQFWIPRKKKNVNLGNAFYIKQIHSVLWKEKYLKPNEYILLKPGDIVFAVLKNTFIFPQIFRPFYKQRVVFAVGN